MIIARRICKRPDSLDLLVGFRRFLPNKDGLVAIDPSSADPLPASSQRQWFWFIPPSWSVFR